MTGGVQLSALVVVHNEDAQLADCLAGLAFADEIVVVLDKCTDGSKDIAARFTDRLIEGTWELEGDRRNAGIEACRGAWIFEIDADERVPEVLAREIVATVNKAGGDIFDVPVHNHIGGRLVRNGWMAAIGTNAAPRLFRKGVKTWGRERVHPHLFVGGRQGPALENALIHYAARNVSDLLVRLDRNTTWRARDLADSGDIGSFPNMVRKIFSRFWKCYVARRGYKENGYGFVIALCAALYPVLSHLKAALELNGREGSSG
ncbi:MAG: glycosyltransferase family 2 protein [Rhodospirillales bacterium]|nr:glycosyltransferase family 2 protein [Rhodospirillales bacterium]